jgi:hypothetical protein
MWVSLPYVRKEVLLLFIQHVETAGHQKADMSLCLARGSGSGRECNFPDLQRKTGTVPAEDWGIELGDVWLILSLPRVETVVPW